MSTPLQQAQKESFKEKCSDCFILFIANIAIFLVARYQYSGLTDIGPLGLFLIALVMFVSNGVIVFAAHIYHKNLKQRRLTFQDRKMSFASRLLGAFVESYLLVSVLLAQLFWFGQIYVL